MPAKQLSSSWGRKPRSQCAEQDPRRISGRKADPVAERELWASMRQNKYLDSSVHSRCTTIVTMRNGNKGQTCVCDSQPARALRHVCSWIYPDVKEYLITQEGGEGGAKGQLNRVMGYRSTKIGETKDKTRGFTCKTSSLSRGPVLNLIL